MYPVLFLALCWIVQVIAYYYGVSLNTWGVLPRTLFGLKGILTSVFVHADFNHLTSNSIPIVVLGLMLFFFYRRIAIPVFVWIWLISGIWLWIGGRNTTTHPTFHLGASTLVYGLATFLFFSGVFRKHLQLMAASAIVVFLYGSILWGIFPLQPGMSWEGHLFGALSGLLVAFNYRNEGPQRKRYEWEYANEEEEDPVESSKANDSIDSDNVQSNTNSEPITFRYIYKQDTPATSEGEHDETNT